jgi:ParB/RepB/Spo0J family partition protein
MNQPNTTELRHLRLDEVRPSKTNPRKDFTSPAAVAYLAELAGTIAEHGVKQPALVRPDYCIGARTTAAIEKARREPVFWQLVFGECRWRASEIAKREELPCIVEELTDDDAREVQQIENLHRRDLTPLEEAQGVEEMLSLQNDDGSPRYTIESLALKLGHKPGWVYKRRELLKLPAAAKKALEGGELSPKVARLIATVPGPARVEFTQKVLKPEFDEGPLSYAAALELRDAEFAKVLKGTPFALEDATLLPEAGACVGCPKMSANCAELFEGDDTAHLKQRTCMDPACYRSKIEALQKRQAVAAEKEGKIMLSPADAAKVYPFYTKDGDMDPQSPYVQIARKPADHLIKKEVLKVPSWEKLVTEAEEKTGIKVPRVLIADQKGVLREHVETKLAIAAIEKSGEPIFRGPAERQVKGVDDYTKQRRAEQERAKLNTAVAIAAVDALHAALVLGWDSEAVWEALFDIALGHAGGDGAWLIGKWKGLKFESDGDAKSKVVRKWAATLKPVERDALVPVLLVSQAMKWSATGAEGFVALAKALKLDVKAIEKKATEAYRAGKQAKKPGKKQAAAKVTTDGRVVSGQRIQPRSRKELRADRRPADVARGKSGQQTPPRRA